MLERSARQNLTPIRKADGVENESCQALSVVGRSPRPGDSAARYCRTKWKGIVTVEFAPVIGNCQFRVSFSKQVPVMASLPSELALMTRPLVPLIVSVSLSFALLAVLAPRSQQVLLTPKPWAVTTDWS
jgi:hypothetical protein